mgnify:CR=1 FL=1
MSISNYPRGPADNPSWLTRHAGAAQAVDHRQRRGVDQQAHQASQQQAGAAPQSSGSGGDVPEGVDPALWAVMKPEEKALWQR